MEKTPKKNSSRLQLVITVLITAALFLAELYVMINESRNIVLLLGIAVLILIALYFVVDAILDCGHEKEIASHELFDDINRSEKASYMLLKKNLEEISKQMRAINAEGEKGGVDSEEIVKTQKALAKISMNKTKESQDRLFIELNNLEASLNDSIAGLSQKLSGFQEEIERLADHLARVSVEAVQEASKQVEVRTVTEVAPASEDFSFEDELFTDADTEEAVSADELDFGDIDLGAFDIEESPSEEVADEDILSQLLAAEEAPIAEEVTPEPEPIPEPVIEEAPTPAPAPADNGGKMGQDDIAALIASMTGGDAAPAPEPEPTPAPAPVDDNPNRMMTPEEIAALIAGTSN